MIGLRGRFRFLRPCHRSLCNPHKIWPRRPRGVQQPSRMVRAPSRGRAPRPREEFRNLDKRERTDGPPPLMLIPKGDRLGVFSGPAPASAGLLAAGSQAFVDDGYRSHVDPVV